MASVMTTIRYMPAIAAIELAGLGAGSGTENFKIFKNVKLSRQIFAERGAGPAQLRNLDSRGGSGRGGGRNS